MAVLNCEMNDKILDVMVVFKVLLKDKTLKIVNVIKFKI